MKVTIIPIGIGAYDTETKELSKGLGYLEVGGRVETIQNTEKSPGDLKRPAVTESRVKTISLC